MAIIALLAGLLLPSLSGAKRRAQSAACVSNLHQLGLALNLYVGDNDNHLPVCAWPLPSLGTNQPPLPSITNALMPYVKSREVFRCPADSSIFPGEHTSYEWNGWLNGASYDHSEDWSDLTKTLVDEFFGGRFNTPLIGDAAPFHPAEGIWSGKNAFYFDGRVQKTKMHTALQQTQVSDFPRPAHQISESVFEEESQTVLGRLCIQLLAEESAVNICCL
jgi:hypothetical protein